MTQAECADPLPTQSALTGMSREGALRSPNSLSREVNSAYVSIVMSVGERSRCSRVRVLRTREGEGGLKEGVARRMQGDEDSVPPARKGDL